jgi:hypothetical protein
MLFAGHLLWLIASWGPLSGLCAYPSSKWPLAWRSSPSSGGRRNFHLVGPLGPSLGQLLIGQPTSWLPIDHSKGEMLCCGLSS